MKTIKKIKLDNEEKEILQAVEAGEVYSLPKKEKERIFSVLQQATKNTLAKTRSITLRISEADLHRLKVTAQQKGIPYQTYIKSLLHTSDVSLR